MSLGRRVRTLTGAFALMLLGNGCYHAGKDALARSAQADFREAHITSSLDDELSYSTEMLKAELAATQRSVEARRDEAVARILDFQWGGAPANAASSCPVSGGAALAGNTPTCALNMLLERVGGRIPGGALPEQALAGVMAGRAKAEALEDVVARSERLLATLLRGRESVTCPASGTPDASVVRKRPELRPVFDKYADECAQLADARKAAQFPATGLLGSVTEHWTEEKNRIDDAKKQAASLKTAYDAARKAYDDAVTARTKRRDELKGAAGDLKAYDEKLSDASGKAQKALDALAAAGVADGSVQNVFAAVEEVRARYDGMVEAIGRIASGEPKSGSGLEVVLSAGLKLEEIRGASGLPRLLLEAERLRGRLAILRVLANHSERRLALLAAERTALFDEVTELMTASRELANARSACAKGKVSNLATVYEVFNKVPGACREGIATSLILYANAYSIGELRAGLAEKKAIGDLHDQAIEVSAEASIAALIREFQKNADDFTAARRVVVRERQALLDETEEETARAKNRTDELTTVWGFTGGKPKLELLQGIIGASRTSATALADLNALVEEHRAALAQLDTKASFRQDKLSAAAKALTATGSEGSLDEQAKFYVGYLHDTKAAVEALQHEATKPASTSAASAPSPAPPSAAPAQGALAAPH
jgi:hypothetical protein